MWVRDEWMEIEKEILVCWLKKCIKKLIVEECFFFVVIFRSFIEVWKRNMSVFMKKRFNFIIIE